MPHPVSAALHLTRRIAAHGFHPVLLLRVQPHELDGRLPVQNLVEVMAVLKAAGVRHTAVAPAVPKKS